MSFQNLTEVLHFPLPSSQKNQKMQRRVTTRDEEKLNGDPSMKLESEQWHNANLLVGKQHRRWSLALSISDDEEKNTSW